MIHHDDDSQLQGVPAIPVPANDAGPQYHGALEPHKSRWYLFHRRKYKSGNYTAVWREVVDPAQNESERQGF